MLAAASNCAGRAVHVGYVELLAQLKGATPTVAQNLPAPTLLVGSDQRGALATGGADRLTSVRGLGALQIGTKRFRKRLSAASAACPPDCVETGR
jgi:hypothetical protein